ncbi:hypothetical protein DFH09DRAFT_1328651 [Mycena vulgaris]|nr:hypothetical protein DFH09DRAFT_1328651 [Mycena vulgaris]
MQSAGISLNIQSRIFEGLLQSHIPETRESYGAGLLCFHQFCDRKGIGEGARMPADRFLLTAFVADAIGSCTGKCVRNWLNGLHPWHTYNDALWHGDEGWVPALKKSADKAGVSFKRPLRGPITCEHLRAFRTSLDLSSSFGVAAWSAALSGTAKFLTLRDTCRNTRVSRSAVNGCVVRGIHIAWTKTTQTVGGECFLTAGLDVDADLCPVWVFENHEHINHSPSPDTLFTFCSPSGWRHLTKDLFLRSSSAVFKSSHLDLVFGHSYRIGGSLELLSAGVAPEIIMKLGGWTSLCFLIYWRRLEQIPLLPSRGLGTCTSPSSHEYTITLPLVAFAYGIGRARIPSPSDPDLPAAFAAAPWSPVENVKVAPDELPHDAVQAGPVPEQLIIANKSDVLHLNVSNKFTNPTMRRSTSIATGIVSHKSMRLTHVRDYDGSIRTALKSLKAAYPDGR